MSNCAELADYEWLTEPAAARILRDLSGGDVPLHTAASRLRSDHSAARVHLLLEQAELRERGKAKFDRADEMFFTRLGLEQATDQWVAAHKARRFAGRGSVADLCCGIGGDFLALGMVTAATGIDRDPIAAHLAAANANALGVSSSVIAADVADFRASEFAAWHIDPDRRPAGSRTTALEWSSPGIDVVERLLVTAPHAAIKLAPAADVPAAWEERCELEWISRDRECRQLVAWHGDLAQRPGMRSATVLSNDGVCLRTVVGKSNGAMPYVDALDRFVFEPDSAVLAAHLVGALASQSKLSAFEPGIAYLTGPLVIEDAALACFEVDDVLPLDVRQLAKHLRDRNIGRVEIKKRGVDHDPALVRKQLRLAGDEEATLLLTKLNGKHVAVVARRIAAPTSDQRSHATAHETRL